MTRGSAIRAEILAEVENIITVVSPLSSCRYRRHYDEISRRITEVEAVSAAIDERPANEMHHKIDECLTTASAENARMGNSPAPRRAIEITLTCAALPIEAKWGKE